MVSRASIELAVLATSTRDQARLAVWAQSGCNAREAARRRPDLGSYRTFNRTRRRYQHALGEWIGRMGREGVGSK